MRFTQLVLAIALSGIAVLSVAQTATKPTFDVASIKLNTSHENRVSVGMDSAKRRFVTSNASVRTIIKYAFDTHLPEEGLRREMVLFGTSGLQVLGGPSWMRSDHFDIEAKPPADRVITQSEMQLMVQSLLEDRFQLKSHYESREVPVYQLVVVKEGKMKLSQDQTSGASDEKRTIGGVPLRRGTWTIVNMDKPERGRTPLLHMLGNAIPMSAVVSMIQGWADRPVVDQTNLAGLFDVESQFSPSAVTATDSDPAGPSVFTAIQQDLGLKLESAKGSAEFLVIESIQRPSDN